MRESQKDVQRFHPRHAAAQGRGDLRALHLDVIKAMSGMKLLTEQEKQMVQQALAMWQQFAQGSSNTRRSPAGPAAGRAASAAPCRRACPSPRGDRGSPEEPSWEQIMAVLRNEKLRGFVVDVETDSTIEPDQQAQQQSAEQFVSAVAQFMTAALPIMQAEPEAADFLGELMAWATRQWKGADTIEGAVDEFVEKMKKKAQQPKGPSARADAGADGHGGRQDRRGQLPSRRARSRSRRPTSICRAP
jgi:hypothetical protein